MTLECLIALIVFLVTYALIALRKIPGTKIGRAGIALIGGALMIVLGILPFTEIWTYINYVLLLLLFGMMLIVAGLESVGFFDIIVKRLIAGGSGRRKFLVSLMLLSATLSALMLNDAVVLLLTPVTVKCCRILKADPVPFLVGLFISSNIGSVATAVGNPQNAYIATQAGITFIEFSVRMLPLMLITIFVAVAMIVLFFRKDLDRIKDTGNADEIEEAEKDPLRLKAMFVLLLATVILFTLSDMLGIPLYVVALISGAVALLIGMTKGVKRAVWMVRRVDWSIILFFVGLFVLMGGVVTSGLLTQITGLFPGFGEGETPSIAGLTALSAVLSNLFSNVPSVILISEMIPSQEVFWITLAASSTLAGNATLIGAAANMIVAEGAEKYNVKLDFWRAVKIGLPVAIVSLLITIVYMEFIF
ncbi:MAG: SLC13 family permease [Candidatus Methanomethylophilaceae archaeon]